MADLRDCNKDHFSAEKIGQSTAKCGKIISLFHLSLLLLFHAQTRSLLVNHAISFCLTIPHFKTNSPWALKLA